jgi:hypothetical protein
MQGAIMKRMAAPNLLNVVLATTALRLAAYAALPAAGTPWAVLPVELLHVGYCVSDIFLSHVQCMPAQCQMDTLVYRHAVVSDHTIPA